MTDFVFLGPSLTRDRASELLDAVYLPPVAMGDLYLLVETRARPGDRIAIIDGMFENVPAVWHKEILYALSSGMHIFGASSMGALRAAETAPYGMVGVGEVYAAYQNGLIEDDDEVAVAHATSEHGYRPLSDAMVNIRFAVERLVAQGIIESSDGAALIRFAKAQHYSERNWGDVLREARSKGLQANALDALKAAALEQGAKAADAAQLLTYLATTSASALPFVAEFSFNRTSYWVSLAESRRFEIERFQRQSGFGVVPGEIDAVRLLRAAGGQREAHIDRALLDHLALRLAGNDEPSSEELREASHRIAKRIGVQSRDQLLQWRQEQQLSDVQWRALLQLHVARARMRAELVSMLDPMIVLALKEAGQFDNWYKLAEDVSRAKAETGVTDVRPADWGVDIDEVQTWYESRFGQMRPDPEAHAMSLGFPTLRAFIDELVMAIAFDRKQQLPD